MNNVSELFGSMVFSDAVMKERLPKETYRALKESIVMEKYLSPEVASVIASAMKDWAIEKGATHFTHWFQPLTGITAGKHDGFISPAENGKAIMEFSGKELSQGEPDASSFPSGGLRATFEARGYTAWDPNSYAFVKDGVLYIPTAFCSYGGEALDKKTPLLRSMEALNRQALRIVRLFGNTTATRIHPTVGAEQEYFLIDREVYKKRSDLIYTGRTLFGLLPPKGQEMEDHYLGAIKPRVAAFMNDLNEELWKLGVPAKTEHNEAAPGQHELACVYETANISADHNQLVMEVMRTTAEKHGMVCLLAEKPFQGVNGSGKHNNWSMATDAGENLLEPGDTPAENAQFITILCAVIKAVDEYQDLLRISAAGAGNDRRLGSGEAPPAILSVYLGDEVSAILESFGSDTVYEPSLRKQFKAGVHTLPRFSRDSTDRNRTSPFAFTGNKFEFRMVGSGASIADANVMINTAVAEELRQFADRLENAGDFEGELHGIIRECVREHGRIIFNGNGYGSAWVEEAEKRGLLNLKTTPDCLPYLVHEKNIKLFAEHRVFSETELRSRLEIILEGYCKRMNIEALTMVDITVKDILPAVDAYIQALSASADARLRVCPDADCSFEREAISELSGLSGRAFTLARALSDAAAEGKETASVEKQSVFFKEKVSDIMNALRETVDAMEALTARSYWPLPSYGELMFSVS